MQTLADLGNKHDRTPAQVAIAWILDHPEVTAPIIGPDLPEHVDEVMGGLKLQLSPEERSVLDQTSRVEGPRKYA